MLKNKYTFTFKKNFSQKVYVEKIDEKKLKKNDDGSSPLFFIDEYNQVLNIIGDLDKNNNLILFTGQRGSGKTSAIESIAKYLHNNKYEENTYYCLPMIDPSFFTKDTNLLKTVLSRMFGEAKSFMKKQNKEDDNPSYEKLLKAFDKVQNALGVLEASGKLRFNMETLNETSEALDMNDLMQDLVDRYIDYKTNDRKNISKLVLIIDDIDMNVSCAADMLEQIRKFLMLDNLIIMMSANLQQLQNEICERINGSYPNSLKDNNSDVADDVEDQATKYLLKVFPTSRRVHVENPAERLADTYLKIVNDKDEEEREGPLQNLILTMIWEKTRLLFVPKDAEKIEGKRRILHPIIPTNLRELSHFLEMLVKLKPISNDGTKKNELFPSVEDYDQIRENFYTFKNYILKNWIPNRLSVEEERVFENIPSDITEINKHLINSINVIGTKHKKRLMSREVDLELIARNAEDVKIDRDIYTMVSPNDPRFVKANKISDIFNQPSNYSYGDLLLMIDKYETYFESDEDRRFTNAIKIYYSMLLFETMYFNSSDVIYDFETADSKETDILHRIIPIQKLIGGTMYYPNYFEIITSKYFSQKGPSFDAKRAFYHKMELEEVKPGKNKNFKEPLGCPLFSVLYYGDVRPDRYDMKHIYDTTYEGDSDVDGVRYATFDILSVLNNMLNPWQTIKRAEGTPTMGEQSKMSYWRAIIDSWKKCNTVDGGISYPNSILPFYSVDLMLCYLRNIVPVSEIIGSEDDLFNNRYDPYNYRLFLKGDYNNLKESKEAKTLDTSWNILDDAYSDYAKLFHNPRAVSTRPRSVEEYRNYVIALILSKYQCGKKETDTLIKGLHKYESVSEIYLYLVEKLWRDALMEKCVKLEIQKKVHAKTAFTIKGEKEELTAIERYYNKLWTLTETSFVNISKGLSLRKDGESEKDGKPKLEPESDDKVVGVYRKIFTVAKQVFIEEKVASTDSNPS